MSRINELSPDGVLHLIRWEKFTVNTSIFIPCIDTAKAMRVMNAKAKEEGWKFESRVRIEGGKFGVRFWRIK